MSTTTRFQLAALAIPTCLAVFGTAAIYYAKYEMAKTEEKTVFEKKIADTTRFYHMTDEVLLNTLAEQVCGTSAYEFTNQNFEILDVIHHRLSVARERHACFEPVARALAYVYARYFVPTDPYREHGMSVIIEDLKPVLAERYAKLHPPKPEPVNPWEVFILK